MSKRNLCPRVRDDERGVEHDVHDTRLTGAMVAQCYNPPQFFTSLPSIPKAAPSIAAPAPATAPVAPPIPAQPTTPPQPSIKTRTPSPMQVDPANVPLPTLSTASRTTPRSAMSSPPSPRTQRIIQRMQQEAAALASGSVSPPRGRATTREGQELRNALRDMFGLEVSM